MWGDDAPSSFRRPGVFHAQSDHRVRVSRGLSERRRRPNSPPRTSQRLRPLLMAKRSIATLARRVMKRAFLVRAIARRSDACRQTTSALRSRRARCGRKPRRSLRRRSTPSFGSWPAMSPPRPRRPTHARPRHRLRTRSLHHVGTAGASISAQHRFQPADMARLTADRVPALKLKWAFGFPGVRQAYGQPTIVGGRLFVGSAGRKVYSLDARSGCQYWAFDSAAPVRAAITIAIDGWHVDGVRRRPGGKRVRAQRAHRNGALANQD